LRSDYCVMTYNQLLALMLPDLIEIKPSGGELTRPCEKFCQSLFVCVRQRDEMDVPGFGASAPFDG
jgi:hypothetical protein